jgi:hypothetical protein
MTTYIVPCVAKAVHIVEILRTAPSGLHMAELRSLTQYPPSTIYRILRTLVGCGYLHHNMRGAYVLNLKVIHAKKPEVDIVGDESGIVGVEGPLRQGREFGDGFALGINRRRAADGDGLASVGDACGDLL